MPNLSEHAFWDWLKGYIDRPASRAIMGLPSSADLPVFGLLDQVELDPPCILVVPVTQEGNDIVHGPLRRCPGKIELVFYPRPPAAPGDDDTETADGFSWMAAIRIFLGRIAELQTAARADGQRWTLHRLKPQTVNMGVDDQETRRVGITIPYYVLLAEDTVGLV